MEVEFRRIDMINDEEKEFFDYKVPTEILDASDASRLLYAYYQ